MRLDDTQIALAAEFLKQGNVVAIPTETVYGLAANALDEAAVRRIFEAKGRPMDNPLIVHIADPDDASLYGETSELSKKLAARFWPGPLTMILPKRNCIPYAVTAGLESVALRCPSHKIAREIIRAGGLPLAAPSANLSGKPSPTSAEHVLHDFGDRIAAVVDGGFSVCGVESTVVSLVGEHPVLLRPGFVTAEQLREVLPDLQIADGVLQPLDADEQALSPGLKHKHYAPSADTVGLIGPGDAVAAYVRANKDSHTAVMCFEGEEPLFDGCRIFVYGKAGDAASQAAHLFDGLRQLDETDATRIYIHAEQADGVGLAVYNRLLRACNFQIVRL